MSVGRGGGDVDGFKVYHLTNHTYMNMQQYGL